jgi:muconate cycloisomerase
MELPFKKPFKHAAAARSTSYSIMLKCTTDSEAVGFGECLPRDYVTGESRDEALKMLKEKILPKLLGRQFASLDEVKSFLHTCNGKAPAEWVPPATPQTAAWAAVDLALLDAFGRSFGEPVRLGPSSSLPPGLRYSIVASAAYGFKAVKSFLLYRLYGFRQMKLKIESGDPEQPARFARRIMGGGCDIRADVNMAWDVAGAKEHMPDLADFGIRSFEQPVAADDLTGMAELVRDTGLDVMADESLHDADSLERLISLQACTAVNVRISKCGGLIAALNRCTRALEAGLTVQIGCQVGETSLLSAAQLILLAEVPQVRYAEGCFGLHLLRHDPVQPVLQFGYGGRPPQLPAGPGLGVQVDEEVLLQWCTEKTTVDH